MLLSKPLSPSLNTGDISRLFLSFSDKELTQVLVGISITTFGDDKLEFYISESSSFIFNFSSGSNLNHDD